tara:strand:+ start:1801 stop:1968 length:168 start_codon:yes stop_codon:yes gene_type:complete
MPTYRVQLFGEVVVDVDSEEFAVTMVRQMLGDDLDLAELNLEVVASEIPEPEEGS